MCTIVLTYVRIPHLLLPVFLFTTEALVAPDLESFGVSEVVFFNAAYLEVFFCQSLCLFSSVFLLDTLSAFQCVARKGFACVLVSFLSVAS